MSVDLNVHQQYSLNLGPQNGPKLNLEQVLDLFQPKVGQSPFSDFLKNVMGPPPGGVPLMRLPGQSPVDQMMQGISLMLQGMGRSMQTQPQYGVVPPGQGDLSETLSSMGDSMQGIADFIGLLQGDLGNPFGLPNANPLPMFGPPPLVSPFDNPLSPAAPKTDDDALKTVDQNFDALAGDKGYIDKKDLEAAAKDTKNPALADAAQHLLDNPMLFNGLDTAFQNATQRKATTDGHVSRADVTTGLNSTRNSASEQDIVKTLLSFGNDLFKNDRGTVTQDDLKSIATKGKMPNGKDAPPELKSAVEQLLANPSLMNKLDAAFDVDSGRFKNKTGLDKEISLTDLLLVAERRPATKTSDAKPNDYFTGSSLMNNFSNVLLNNLQKQGADPTMLNVLREAMKPAA